ncbi:MAG: hypothetical protein ACO395_10085 [Pontimonas sp.]
MSNQEFQALCLSLMTVGNYMSAKLSDMPGWQGEGIELFSNTVQSIGDTATVAAYIEDDVPRSMFDEAVAIWAVWLFIAMTEGVPYPEGGEVLAAAEHIDRVLIDHSA